MIFIWKILEIYADDGLITSAKYLCSVSDGEKSVDTEGYWTFQEPQLIVPFDQVTEEMIAQWIEDSSVVDGKNIIKSRLVEQLKNLQQQPVPAPWMPQVFTPNL